MTQWLVFSSYDFPGLISHHEMSIHFPMISPYKKNMDPWQAPAPAVSSETLRRFNSNGGGMVFQAIQNHWGCSPPLDPLNSHISMERSTIFRGKTHEPSMAIFQFTNCEITRGYQLICPHLSNGMK